VSVDALLTIDGFSEFFAAVHRGASPFPWQLELLQEVDERRRWPDTVALPTGTGKTSLLDLAVYLLALDAQRLPAVRWVPRRVVFVVDRRLVVDQAADHAQILADTLRVAPTGTITRMAALLSGLSEGAEPLVTTRLRGGTLMDDSWTRRPDVPAVISTTVDQSGSRLLFRGYGLGRGMRPVHAGLLGNDVLWLLDEVHLSQPFAQTLEAIGSYRRWADDEAATALPDRWSVVQLSATPPRPVTSVKAAGDAVEWTYPSGPLDPGDSTVLRRRLGASKPARLVSIPATTRRGGAEADPLVGVCVREVGQLLDLAHVRTLGVIVNRVDTARAVWRVLCEAAVPAVLLTGRMRPYERDALTRALGHRLTTGRGRDAEQDRLVVVATQCLEAGADYDLDGLVTECASLDALRQRFGRVDRDGQLSEAGTPAPGVILARATDLAAVTDDPVYGTALAATFDWLSNLGQVDFGVGRLPYQRAPLETMSPRRRAPVLFPAHLDAWVQTSPAPTPDPEPSRWLHGAEPTVADVSLVWRADLSVGLLEEYADDAVALIMRCPPVSLEAVSLPLPAVQRWLRDMPPTKVADVEGQLDIEARDDDSETGGGGEEAGDDGETNVSGGAGDRLALRWAGPDSEVVRPERLRPGDVVVVPADYGGLVRSAYGEVGAGAWDPGQRDEPVADLATEAQLLARRRAVVRLAPELWRDLAPSVVTPAQVDDAGDRSDRTAVLECLGDLAQLLLPGPLQDTVRHLAHAPALGVWRMGAPPHFFLVASESRWSPSSRAGSSTASVAPDTEPERISSEEDEGSYLAARVGLDRHLADVEGWAALLTRNLGLPEPTARDVSLAGRLHDLGKADPRFQVLLRGGNDADYWADPEPLAKSDGFAPDRRARARVRAVSGYPEHGRHELLSLAMISEVEALASRAGDWDLVCHLVASHHGWCRPFAPVALDDQPVMASHDVDGQRLEVASDHHLERLDAGVPERFWRLVRRYGWYRLAWLEAILRLADHRASEEEQDKVLGAERGDRVVSL